jgi:hypothetical protein
VYTYSRKTQTELFSIFQEFEAFITRQFNRKIKIFRIDRKIGLGKSVDIWAIDKGIDFEIFTPYSSEQNGSAEHFEGVIITKARCIRIRSSLPEDI